MKTGAAEDVAVRVLQPHHRAGDHQVDVLSEPGQETAARLGAQGYVLVTVFNTSYQFE